MKQNKEILNSLTINKMVVIGVGLIGGSLAKVLRTKGMVKQLVGVGRNEQNLKRAVAMGVIDSYSLDAAEAVQGADLVLISTPVLGIEKVLVSIKDSLSPDTIITDAGSAKGIVVAAAKKVFGSVPAKFVPGHPIAGSEKSGIEAADEGLYQQHMVILTPLPETDRGALDTVGQLWKAAGAEVVTMDVKYHDQVLAATSHLPHLLAYSLVETLAGRNENREIFRYAAGGFRDFTRIASSDPTMWHDIFLANREAVLKSLDAFSEGVTVLRQALEDQDSQSMMGIFTRAKSARDHFTKLLAQRAYVEPMNESDTTFFAGKKGPLVGNVRVPGDKSISHRSIMLGAIAQGETEVSGFLEGEDSLATLQAFRDMGVVIEGPFQGKVKIYGVGMNGLKAPPGPLYLGNSGTSMRLLAGLLSAQSFDVELTGDSSLSVRPMKRVAGPLAQMGAKIETCDGKPPLTLRGGSEIHGIHYEMPVASAQVKSSLLLAGLYAKGVTRVVEPAPTRDHTERMLCGFGYKVDVKSLSGTSKEISLQGGGVLCGGSIDIPADISSAAFFMVAASIVPGSDITLEHVGINPTRTGVINILRKMGADIQLIEERIVGGEPVADIRVRASQLQGIDIPEDQVPLAIDEFPVLFVAAACAKGRTVLRDAEELRVKESDRIQVMADGLVALGVDANPTADGISIEGGRYQGGVVDSQGDHRIAMAFSVAALRAEGDIEILNCANVATSFPDFVNLANQVGMNVRVEN